MSLQLYAFSSRLLDIFEGMEMALGEKVGSKLFLQLAPGHLDILEDLSMAVHEMALILFSQLHFLAKRYLDVLVAVPREELAWLFL